MASSVLTMVGIGRAARRRMFDVNGIRPMNCSILAISRVAAMPYCEHRRNLLRLGQAGQKTAALNSLLNVIGKW